MSAFTYTPAPTLARFMRSQAFIRIVSGPVGSGKTTACIMELLRMAQQQPLSSDGVRHSRFVVVRNTFRQLRDTTIKSVHEFIPPGVAGKWHASSSTFFLKFGDVESEWMFRALDSPEDASNLLSLEVTGGWLNEAREIDSEIFRPLLGRVGRYPAGKSLPPGVSFRAFVIADTNPPNVGSFWHGMMETPPVSELAELLGLPAGSKVVETFRQPSGLSPQAENMENLPKGYYQRMVALADEKGEEWLKVHVHGEYGADQHHLPVYPEFRRQMHVATSHLTAITARPLVLSFDWGRTPACVAMQIDANSRYNILAEWFVEGTSVDAFLDYLMPQLRGRFPDHLPSNYVCIGDPAGRQRAQAQDITCFEIARNHGLLVRDGPQAPETRIGSVRRLLTRLLPDGSPALRIDPSCRILIAGFEGDYRFKRVRTTDDITATPDKNKASHLHDALQYGVAYHEAPTMRGGKARDSSTQPRQPRQPGGPSHAVVTDWGSSALWRP